MGLIKLVWLLNSTKIIGSNVIRTILSLAWNMGDHVWFTHLQQNIYLFSFINVADQERVLETRSWTVKGTHVILKPRAEDTYLEEIDFSFSPLLGASLWPSPKWVQYGWCSYHGEVCEKIHLKNLQNHKYDTVVDISESWWTLKCIRLSG